MTSDAGAGVGILTVGPVFAGTTNAVADIKAYIAWGAVRARCPIVPHPRLECTEAEHELRYVFNLVKYSRCGAPRRGAIMHSGILARMLSIVFPCVDMMRVVWRGLSRVWGLSPVVEISSNDC